MSEPAKNETPAKNQSHAANFPAFPRLDRDIERFFGGRWPRVLDWSSANTALNELPNVDVIDREDEICVRAEVPGFKKEEIDVAVNHNTLALKAQASAEETDEDGDYVRKEMTRNYFARTISLPAEVTGDNTKASLENGVLEVLMPKATASKRQRITID